MATAEECRTALQNLTARISELEAADREKHLVDRTMSCRIPDLDITFLTRIGPGGADSIRQAGNGTPPAQVRFTARSDVVVSIATDPGTFARAWLTGRLKVEGNIFDLFRLRKFI